MNNNSVVAIDSNPDYEMVGKNDIENPPTLVTKISNSWKGSGKHSISWNTLSWEVDIKKMGAPATKKKILKNVSGYVESGNVSQLSPFKLMVLLNLAFLI